MTNKLDGFLFNAKQWLGDDAVLLMDWDARAMHLHLLCLAWQQEQPGVLPNDDNLLRRWLSNPPATEWTDRLKPQIMRAWRVQEPFIIQDGLAREHTRQVNTSAKRKAAANSRWDKRTETPLVSTNGEDIPPALCPDLVHQGFLLNQLTKESGLFMQRATTAERTTIWTVGVSLLIHPEFDEGRARSYIGKLISEFGEQPVAQALTQMSLKALPAADAKGYLIGVLKGESTKRKGRGKVAL